MAEEFDVPWRHVAWGREEKDKLLQEIKNLKPTSNESKEFRIVLYGQVGAGKSSCFNTINSVFQGHMTSRALALLSRVFKGPSVWDTNQEEDPFKYTAYRIRERANGTWLPFALCDVMGTEDQEGKGTHPKDIINAVKGHVSEKYKFNLVSPLSEDSPFFNKSPTLNDKAHCFVYIVSADQVSLLTGGIVDKIKTVKSEVTDLGVPQVVLLTKVDLACPVVKDDLKNVYKSKYIKELMEKCSQIIGIPANCILPVKNYHEETTLNDDVDVDF